MTDKDNLLVWIDLEMTGLDPDHCAIVQLGMILTNSKLEEVGEPLEITIWQPESVLERMEPFVRSMHEKSGLLDGIRKSEISTEDAERKALEVVSQKAPYRTARLCGNSVWQDRRFMMRYMPQLDGYLHYRQVDVSTIKELCGWWYKEKFEKPVGGQHTALFDIRQSLEELRFYRKQIFR